VSLVVVLFNAFLFVKKGLTIFGCVQVFAGVRWLHQPLPFQQLLTLVLVTVSLFFTRSKPRLKFFDLSFAQFLFSYNFVVTLDKILVLPFELIVLCSNFLVQQNRLSKILTFLSRFLFLSFGNLQDFLKLHDSFVGFLQFILKSSSICC